jgi:putative endopeptidase
MSPDSRVVQAVRCSLRLADKLPLTRSATVFVTVALCVAAIGLSAQTRAREDVLAANVDSNVLPGDDFYQYATGAWLKQHPLPDDQARWGIGNVGSDEIYSQLRRISEAAAARTAPRGSAAQLIGDFFATGMDEATINRQGLAPLRPEFDRINRIASIEDVMDVVALLHKRTMLIDGFLGQQRVLFSARIEQDEADSQRWIYNLAQGGISVRPAAYSGSDAQSVKVRNALREYLVKTFMRLGGDSAQAATSADAVYNLEARLAKAFITGNQSRRVSVAELRQIAPRVDWTRYFNRLGAGEIAAVTIRHPQFFEALDAAIGATRLDDWRAYLRFWLIRLNAPFLDDATYAEFFALESAVTGQLQPRPRWRRVVWQEKNWLGLPLVKLFESEFLAARTRARYRTVGESIRRAFRSRIQRLDWMGEATKRAALLKLARLEIIVGVPDSSIDFSTMPLQRDVYVLNMIRAAEWFHDQQIKRLTAPFDPAAVDLYPAIGGDAYYEVSNNKVQIPNPTRAPGVRDEDLDDAFVYASSSLGHEIAHAFDSEGRHFDADGNKVNWWTPSDTAAFEKRAQVLIDQYSEFMPLEGMRIDGRTTLAENLADLVGLRVALDAFKQTRQFKDNKRIGGFTPLQRFFLAYAYPFAGHERKEALAARLKGGGYAPNRERVNGVVMNLPEFYEAFGVKPGDRMYRSENARVKIW